jgi:hypothetical protein
MYRNTTGKGRGKSNTPVSRSACVIVIADIPALVGGNREVPHKKTSGLRPADPIPSARRAVAFERAGAQRRRSRARPALEPADGEGSAVRLAGADGSEDASD